MASTFDGDQDQVDRPGALWVRSASYYYYYPVYTSFKIHGKLPNLHTEDDSLHVIETVGYRQEASYLNNYGIDLIFMDEYQHTY